MTPSPPPPPPRDQVTEAADREAAICHAITRFGEVLRTASRGERWGQFGVLVELQEGRIDLLRIEWRETAKMA